MELQSQNNSEIFDFENYLVNTRNQVRPYTMVPDSGVDFLIHSVKQILDKNIPGDFVECGVWKGGCVAAMRLTQIALQPHSQRQVHLFDSFQGLPPVQVVDGPMAAEWQANTNSSIYYDNCTASINTVKQNFTQLGILDEKVKFYPGWFENTIPEFAHNNPNFRIAILRLDGDWYSSTKVCLENLYPFVSEKGIIIIDDYYAWDGCALAVHEFLAKNQLNHRICSIPDFTSAYMVKKQWRDE